MYAVLFDKALDPSPSFLKARALSFLFFGRVLTASVRVVVRMMMGMLGVVGMLGVMGMTVLFGGLGRGSGGHLLGGIFRDGFVQIVVCHNYLVLLIGM